MSNHIFEEEKQDYLCSNEDMGIINEINNYDYI